MKPFDRGHKGKKGQTAILLHATTLNGFSRAVSAKLKHVTEATGESSEKILATTTESFRYFYMLYHLHMQNIVTDFGWTT